MTRLSQARDSAIERPSCSLFICYRFGSAASRTSCKGSSFAAIFINCLRVFQSQGWTNLPWVLEKGACSWRHHLSLEDSPNSFAPHRFRQLKLEGFSTLRILCTSTLPLLTPSLCHPVLFWANLLIEQDIPNPLCPPLLAAEPGWGFRGIVAYKSLWALNKTSASQPLNHLKWDLTGCRRRLSTRPWLSQRAPEEPQSRSTGHVPLGCPGSAPPQLDQLSALANQPSVPLSRMFAAAQKPLNHRVCETTETRRRQENFIILYMTVLRLAITALRRDQRYQSNNSTLVKPL
ncbi:uncharacterized protein LOC113483411 [Athene cunicularia]|uniref:uncharacterized protein LOC113483411 n=1 Tax=Athene cunicularia TaxID=194338 RepID=UPI000EF64EDA|nr:uncharacterized protein LOC113483411 [Athene cunicularia]